MGLNMTMHQEHYGKKFYQDKKTGYWISTTSPRVRAHVWVWNHYHGNVPKGYHIHHKDGNNSNNSILNLDILSACNHQRHHFEINPERRERMKAMADANRHLTKAWHSSEEGTAWHKFHGIKAWNERQPFKIICKVCSKESMTKTFHQDFCSNVCKSKWRRQSGIDNVLRNCPICYKEFTCNKYSKTVGCSRSCGRLHNSLNKKLGRLPSEATIQEAITSAQAT